MLICQWKGINGEQNRIMAKANVGAKLKFVAKATLATVVNNTWAKIGSIRAS